MNAFFFSKFKLKSLKNAWVTPIFFFDFNSPCFFSRIVINRAKISLNLEAMSSRNQGRVASRDAQNICAVAKGSAALEIPHFLEERSRTITFVLLFRGGDFPSNSSFNGDYFENGFEKREYHCA